MKRKVDGSKFLKEAQAKGIAELEAEARDRLIERNRTLEARIAELEAENAELERQIENYKAFLDGSEDFPQESPF